MVATVAYQPHRETCGEDNTPPTGRAAARTGTDRYDAMTNPDRCVAPHGGAAVNSGRHDAGRSGSRLAAEYFYRVNLYG